MSPQPLVSVVDDDESVREALPDLLKVLGFSVQAFASAEAFLSSQFLGQTRCLILDMNMPGMSGPELKRELEHRNHTIPVVFITANGDANLRARAIREGAVECLTKPFSETALLDAVNSALRVN